MNLRPWEFGKLTPGELEEMLDGYSLKQEQEWERTAWQTAHILNLMGKSLKRDVTVDDLLKKNKEIKRLTPEEKQKEWEAIDDEF